MPIDEEVAKQPLKMSAQRLKLGTVSDLHPLGDRGLTCEECDRVKFPQ
jgi:hypothetical protein